MPHPCIIVLVVAPRAPALEHPSLALRGSRAIARTIYALPRFVCSLWALALSLSNGATAHPWPRQAELWLKGGIPAVLGQLPQPYSFVSFNPIRDPIASEHTSSQL